VGDEVWVRTNALHSAGRAGTTGEKGHNKSRGRGRKKDRGGGREKDKGEARNKGERRGGGGFISCGGPAFLTKTCADFCQKSLDFRFFPQNVRHICPQNEAEIPRARLSSTLIMTRVLTGGAAGRHCVEFTRGMSSKRG
jgi:hypothetical protein